MPHRAADMPDIGARDPVVDLVEPAEDRVAALVVPGGLEDRRAQRRGEAQRQERREAHRHRDRDRELLVDLARAAGLRSEEHTSELQSLMRISYAVFCLQKKKSNLQSTRV